jgi:hypothetical protein
MHWVVSGGPSAPLAFGGAWHEAMDVVWRGVKDGLPRTTIANEAHTAFERKWVLEKMPDPNDIDMETQRELGARTPMRALEMIIAYVHEREKFIKENELVHIERPFAVPLDPNDDTLFYIGRIDKIIKPSKNHYRGIEHKTTTASKKDGLDYRIRPLFMESFSPNSQVDGYVYALYMLYGVDVKVDVWVDAALVHKSGEDFRFIPVDRKMAMLDQWLWITKHWVNLIETNASLLAEASPSDAYLAAFPMNTSSCFDFNVACPYLPLCKSRPNPLTWLPDVPAGYKVEKWDPLDHTGTPDELK